MSKSFSAGNDQARSILVICFRYIGDLIVLTPLLHNLRLQMPESRLCLLADDAYAGLVACFPDIDEFIPYPRRRGRRASLWSRTLSHLRLARLLRRHRFDIVIDISNTRTSRMATKITGAPMRIGFPHGRRRGPAHFYTQELPPLKKGELFCEHYLKPLRALGLPECRRAPVVRPSPEDEAFVDDLLAGAGLRSDGFAAMHAGARVARKFWPARSFAEVASSLSPELPVVLVGGPDERAIAERVVEEARVPVRNFAAQLSIGQLAALLQRSRVFIGNDSGPMHLAAAMGTPVVAMFGPSLPAYWAPIGSNNIVLSRHCKCGFNMKYPTACDATGPECLREISVEEVLAAARELLGQPITVS